jgi:hypothetical protein
VHVNEFALFRYDFELNTGIAGGFRHVDGRHNEPEVAVANFLPDTGTRRGGSRSGRC